MIPPLILGTVLLAALTVLSTALGRRLLRWLSIETTGDLELALLSLGLGLGSLQAIPFILFATGIGDPIVFRIALVVLTLILLTDVRAVLHSAWRALTLRVSRSWWEYILIAVLTILLGSIYVRAVCPPTDIDALLYHLTIARRFLEEGRFIHLVTITPSNWPLGVESLFSVLLAMSNDAPISIVQFLFGLLSITVVYSYGRRICGRLCAATAVCVLLVQWMFWWEMATGYIDLGLTAFAALMVYALDRSSRFPVDIQRWQVLAAVFAGLAATTKLQGLWVIVVFVILLFLTAPGGSFRNRVRTTFALGSLAMAIVLPWYIRTWVLTGNPVYPMLYGIFGGSEWTADGWKRYAESYLITDAISTGLPLTSAVVYSTYALRIGGGIVAAWAIIYLTRSAVVRIPVWFVVLFTTAIFAGSAANARFLLPALPPFAVASAMVLNRWESRLPIILCLLSIPLAVWIGVWKVRPDLDIAVKGAIGIVSRDEYMRADTTITDFDVAQFANRNLPSTSRILLCLQREHTALYKAQTFWANYRLQDSFHYESDERLQSDLTRLGVTHLVLADGFSAWYGNHPAWKVRNIERAALLKVATNVGTKLFESRGVSLYKLEYTRHQ